MEERFVRKFYHDCPPFHRDREREAKFDYQRDVKHGIITKTRKSLHRDKNWWTFDPRRDLIPFSSSSETNRKIEQRIRDRFRRNGRMIGTQRRKERELTRSREAKTISQVEGPRREGDVRSALGRRPITRVLPSRQGSPKSPREK